MEIEGENTSKSGAKKQHKATSNRKKTQPKGKNQEMVPTQQVRKGLSIAQPKREVMFTNSKLKPLDKHQSEKLRELMGQVQRKYPHYTKCTGCNTCNQVFSTLEITKCSKKHGGQPCNDLALYPHASGTYLDVAHATRKVVGFGYGFLNPMKQQFETERQTTGSADSNTVLKEGRRQSSVTIRPPASLNSAERTVSVGDQRATLEELREQRRTDNLICWKLRHNSAKSHFEFALNKFRIWKRTPHFKVPSWATVGSKVLFETLNCEDAREASTSVYSRRQKYVDKRRTKRIKRSHD